MPPAKPTMSATRLRGKLRVQLPHEFGGGTVRQVREADMQRAETVAKPGNHVGGEIPLAVGQQQRDPRGEQRQQRQRVLIAPLQVVEDQ